MYDIHPLELADILWPSTYFYREQREIIESVWANKETYVVAANKMGKDYVAGRTALLFFLTRHPCRVVTTSAKEEHLDVLWGEMGQAIMESAHPLDRKKGGPLIIKDMEINKVVGGEECPLSYIKGMVAGQQSIASMGGHHIAAPVPDDHIPRTMLMCDESSSVRDEYYRTASPWMNRALIFGNAWPCENFFKRGVRGGDVVSPSDLSKYLRKVFHIRAEDSPNIRLALAQKRAGLPITYERLVAGVKGYDEYLEDLILWDEHQICVSHGADWYEGAEIKLFPPQWLQASVLRWQELAGKPHHGKRMVRYMGVDPGEGAAESAWVVGDELGVIEMVSKKTPDTNDVPDITLQLMAHHSIPGSNVCMDRGGGGKQHADRINGILKARGKDPIRTVGFGETLVLDPKRGLRMIEEKVEQRQEAYAFCNRRSQMYGEASALVDPRLSGYGLPAPNSSAPAERLHHALRVIPKLYDGEGRLELPPKNRRQGDESKKKTLTEMVGGTGKGLDESDALVLMGHAILHQTRRAVASAV